MVKYQTLGSWLLNAFAVPSALQLLSSIDERLNFGPLLERIILKYSIVSTAIWNVVSSVTNLNLKGIEGILTFYSICLALCIRAAFSSPDASLDSDLKIRFIEATSITLVLTCLTLAGYNNFWGVIVLSATFFTIIFLEIGSKSRKGIPPSTAMIVIFIGIVLSFLMGALPNPLVSDGLKDNPYGLPLWAILAIVIGVTASTIGVRNLFFTRILVFALGIFSIDFAHRNVIPSIDTFLKGVGA